MTRYPIETFDDEDADDGTMPDNVENLARHIIGQRIISVHTEERDSSNTYGEGKRTVLTLSNGKRVSLIDSDDCCAFTSLTAFLLHPGAVDHIITGVGTTNGYSSWHVFADMNDVLDLDVDWSPGNPFYYGYGFHIRVDDNGVIPPATDEEIAAALESIKKAQGG